MRKLTGWERWIRVRQTRKRVGPSHFTRYASNTLSGPPASLRSLHPFSSNGTDRNFFCPPPVLFPTHSSPRLSRSSTCSWGEDPPFTESPSLPFWSINSAGCSASSPPVHWGLASRHRMYLEKPGHCCSLVFTRKSWTLCLMWLLFLGEIKWGCEE